MSDIEKKRRIDDIVDGRLREGNYRHEVAHFIPEGSTKIMEYGFGDASLLLGLRRDKKCRKIYGIEVNPHARDLVDDLLDKTWLIDLNKEDAWLEEKYEGYFNFILAPMSMEHTYDPWYVMKKFNKYLAPGGKLIVQTPNIQSWECIYRIITGDFPYMSGGTWDFTHIRWYTLKSLIDISFVAGFIVSDYLPQFHDDLDLSHIAMKKEIKTLRLPPPELGLDFDPIDIVLPFDIKPIYPLFLSHAFVLVLEKHREPEDHAPTQAGGYLESYRLTSPNPLASIADSLNHPIVPGLFDIAKKKAATLNAIIHKKIGD